LAAFLALYIFVQPFLSFDPMDFRDSTTLLCLVQPWLLAALVWAFSTRTYPFLYGYIVLNLLIILVPVGRYAVPEVLVLFPPQVHDLADRYADVQRYRIQGIPDWLLVRPFRMTTLEQHHPDVLALLEQFEDTEHVVVVSNAAQILFNTDAEPDPPVRHVKDFWYMTFNEWLVEGRCRASVERIVILFDWDYLRQSYPQDVAALEEKCPGLSPIELEHGRVYVLPQDAPASSPEPHGSIHPNAEGPPGFDGASSL
jgi:hypothetical protein